MISIYSWDRASRIGEHLTVDQLQTPGLGRDGNHIVWIDMAAPTAEEEAIVFEKFLPIHPLSLEDVTRLRREPDSPPHLPKVEEFPDYLFVIVNPLGQDYLRHIERDDADDESIDSPFTQLSAVLTRFVLITHHMESTPCIGQLTAFLNRHETQADRGPDYLFHLVLDATVDQYAPVLDHIDDSLDDLELRVMDSDDKHLFGRILRLKREIVLLRKTLVYEREVLVRLARGEFELVDERETIYYRNVYDHLVRFTELTESSREMASDLMQSHLATTSNNLNQVMKVLTTISTVVLPMTLVAGVYGMNFRSMPELEWPWGYPLAISLMATMGIGTILLFRWKKWI